MHQSASVGVPESRSPVAAGCDDELAAGTEAGGQNLAVVGAEGVQEPAVVDVPDASRPVVVGGHDAPAVGTEGRGKDGSAAAQDAHEAAGACIPKPRRAVGAGVDDERGVMAERGAEDRAAFS